MAGILAAGSSPAGRPDAGGGSGSSAPWSMHLFHTPTNAALVALVASSQQLSGGRLRLHRIDLPVIDVAAYNRLLKMPLFWDRWGACMTECGASKPVSKVGAGLSVGR